MRNLNEQISRMKSLMLIKEQCAGTSNAELEACEDDLEVAGYKVFSPEEYEASCDQIENIKNLSDIFSKKKNSSNEVLGSNFIISSEGSTEEDCYVLIKSERMQGSLPKFTITFYNDNQIYINLLMGPKNDNKKLTWRGKYSTSSSSLTIGKLRYKGVNKGRSYEMENFDVLKSDGTKISIDASKSSLLSIEEGYLKSKDALTYNLHALGMDKNIMKSDMGPSEAKNFVIKLATT